MIKEMYYPRVFIISHNYRARKLKPLSNKKTLDGIWFLILIIYVYTFDTCFNLLRCVGTEIHTDDFNRTKPGPLVSIYLYDLYFTLLLFYRFIFMTAVSHAFRMSTFHML